MSDIFQINDDHRTTTFTGMEMFILFSLRVPADEAKIVRIPSFVGVECEGQVGLRWDARSEVLSTENGRLRLFVCVRKNLGVWVPCGDYFNSSKPSTAIETLEEVVARKELVEDLPFHAERSVLLENKTTTMHMKGKKIKKTGGQTNSKKRIQTITLGSNSGTSEEEVVGERATQPKAQKEMVVIPSSSTTQNRRPTFRRGVMGEGKITNLAKKVISTAKAKRAPFQQRFISSATTAPPVSTAPVGALAPPNDSSPVDLIQPQVSLHAAATRILGSPFLLLGQTSHGSSISVGEQQHSSDFDEISRFLEAIQEQPEK